MEEFYTAKTIEELKSYLDSQNGNSLVLKIFDREKITSEGLEMINYLANNVDKLRKNTEEVILSIPYEKMPKKILGEIFNLNQKVSNNGNTKLSFCVNHVMTRDVFATYEKRINWDFETIIKANTEIDKVCDFIRKSKFSQFEALAYIHDYVSTITQYNFSNEKHKWSDKDQFFAGAFLEIPEVVCFGYSSLMKEIIDNLNMPGLSCEILAVEFTHLKKNYTEGHTRCLVTITDPKYGIDQSVFDDTTWDNDENLTHKFTHFAMPNDSLENHKNKLYRYKTPDRAEYSTNKANFEWVDENLSFDNFNRSKNQIDQLMIEKAYFNVIINMCQNEDFEANYARLTQMVKDSFIEQTQREFSGNLSSEQILLTKEEAKAIYEQIKNEDLNFDQNIEI